MQKLINACPICRVPAKHMATGIVLLGSRMISCCDPESYSGDAHHNYAGFIAPACCDGNLPAAAAPSQVPINSRSRNIKQLPVVLRMLVYVLQARRNVINVAQARRKAASGGPRTPPRLRQVTRAPVSLTPSCCHHPSARGAGGGNYLYVVRIEFSV